MLELIALAAIALGPSVIAIYDAAHAAIREKQKETETDDKR
jgi:hypothetical protein